MYLQCDGGSRWPRSEGDYWNIGLVCRLYTCRGKRKQFWHFGAAIVGWSGHALLNIKYKKKGDALTMVMSNSNTTVLPAVNHGVELFSRALKGIAIARMYIGDASPDCW